MTQRVAVLDTSVIIPLSYAEGQSLEFTRRLSPLPSIVPSVVDLEVERDPGRQLVDAGYTARTLLLDNLGETHVLQTFVEMTKELDPGEAAVVAVATHHEGLVVTHDKAARRIAASHLGAERVFDLVALMVEAGRRGTCTPEFLDAMVESIRKREPLTMKRAHEGCAKLINVTGLQRL